ncbi:MAG: hypothetical protein ACOWWM_00080 [Desulfobacterales bacterium]
MLKKAAELIEAWLEGKSAPFSEALPDPADDAAAVFSQRFQELLHCLDEIRGALTKLAEGKLDTIRISRGNLHAAPLKELHSRLMHLTWQTQQIAAGDYGQRVDFMGDFSTAFNTMVEALEKNERALNQKISELESALARVKRLEGLLPICMFCKRIRYGKSGGADPRNWEDLDAYVRRNTEAKFSHTICPSCMREQYPDLLEDP